MKLKTILGILTSLLITSAIYGADDFVVQNYIGAKIGMASPAEKGFDDGIGGSLFIGKNFAKHHSFEFEMNLNAFDEENDLGRTLTQYNYIINYRFDANITDWLFIDLGAGGGLSQVKVEENNITEETYVSNAQYFAAVGFQVTDNIDLSVEYKRLWTHAADNVNIGAGFSDLIMLSSTFSF